VKRVTALAVVAVAVAAAVIPVPRSFVERLYSNGIYLSFQPWVTRCSNAVHFALFDALLVVAVGSWALYVGTQLVAAVRGRWVAAVARVVARTAVLAAVSYLAFVAMWGLNYRRVALADTLRLEAPAVTEASARAVGFVAVTRVNGLYREAHASDDPRDADGRDHSRDARAQDDRRDARAHDNRPDSDPHDRRRDDVVDASLAAAFVRAQHELGLRRPAAPARPKISLLDWYFRRASVAGMTDPYFLETLVASDLLPVERPFVVAHEWAHLAGFANEGEANFIGWLTCLRADSRSQYSGWLFLYEEIASAVGHDDRRALAARLDAGPRADLRAIAARIARDVSPRVSSAGWRVYDGYLKANRVEGGTASYGEVIKLVLGTPLGQRASAE